jgi:hypothetical protein
VPAVKAAAPRGGKASTGEKAAAASETKPLPGGPSPAERVADFGTNISVEDYLGGKSFFFDRRRVAGSGEGHLVVVPPSLVATSPSAVVKAKGFT